MVPENCEMHLLLFPEEHNVYLQPDRAFDKRGSVTVLTGMENGKMLFQSESFQNSLITLELVESWDLERSIQW